MLIRFDRLAAASVATLALTSRAQASGCSWSYDSFESPDNNTYAIGQCGYSSKLDHMRRAFVSHCNATAVGYHAPTFWHQVTHWRSVYLYSQERHLNDSQFVDCLTAFHDSAAPRGMSVSAAAVGLSALVFAFGLG